MKKSCIFSIIFCVILVNAFHLQARDEHQLQFCFSAWPVQQSNVGTHVQAYAQINREEKDPYNFNTPQNSSFSSSSSGQDRYQQHRQFILNNIVAVSLQGKTIKITPEDINLINRICADNLHKNQDELRMQLAQSLAFNYAQHFLKGDRELHAFTSDIYINPGHFKAVSESKDRIVKLEKAASKAVEDWYKQEKSKLNSKSKTKSQDAKKLKEKYQRRRQYPLGNKQDVQILINNAKKSAASNPVAPVTKKSNIALQEVQRLHEHNNQVLKVNSAQDGSFQQVMDKRSKAFEVSAKNQVPTTEHIKINSQTRAFLQAQGIDITQFQQVEGLPIQHQLTHELVDILDDVAEYAQQHHYEIYQTHLTKYCAYLASSSQQSNVEGALEQAIDGTNCCHGITHYLEGMVSGVTQAYRQFQTALDYFEAVADTYGNLIVQHGAQGALVAHGLEAIVTAGMIAAPTVTIAATGVMIGATAYVMAPLCAQAMIDTVAFGGACITGNWDKVTSDLDNFGKFISSRETVARMAELAGGAAVPTPNLSCVVEGVLSLRPVITSVQNASGEMVQSLYLMTKNQLQKVYTQGVELLQLPEFVNFNMSYKSIGGFNFFDILPKSHPALAVAMEGIEAGLFNSSEQAVLTQLFTQAEGSVVGNVITSGASSIGSQAAQAIEQGAKSLIAEQISSIAQLHEVLQHEIAQVAKQPILSIDLIAKITDAKYVELRELSSQIRQLQDLAKYTDNFKNLENLIPEDICYLNRVHELQPYRAQIKNFLDTHKLYFVYENEKYFIEDIASYHIHAADYYRKDAPKGGHSNFGGHKLGYFRPQIIKNGPIGTKDVVFYNPRNLNLIKKSTIYPEIWSEFVCDLKAIEVMMSKDTDILNDGFGSLKITGKTTEGLDLIIYYDIAHKRIKSHYPDSEKF